MNITMPWFELLNDDTRMADYDEPPKGVRELFRSFTTKNVSIIIMPMTTSDLETMIGVPPGSHNPCMTEETDDSLTFLFPSDATMAAAIGAIIYWNASLNAAMN